MRGGGVRIEGESGAERNEGGIFRSTLAASEWPAEKREGPRGPGYCLHAVDPLRLDKKERERERRIESRRRFNAPPFRWRIDYYYFLVVGIEGLFDL